MKICRKSMQMAYTEAGEGKETAGAGTKLLRGNAAGRERGSQGM